MDTGTSTAVDDRTSAAVSVDALEVVNELGTHAVAHLNGSHFLLAELEPRHGQHSPRIPSDRWYRLYAQLEQTHTSPCAAYLLSAAALIDEVHVLAERSENLARHSRRAPVREQVAQQLDAVTPWTTQLLDRACTLSQPDLDDDEEERPGQTAPLVAGDTNVFLSHSSPPAESDSRVLIDALVAGAVSGDAQARDELLTLIHPLVLKYCRARLGRQESLMGSADDVAQDVCMAVVSALPNYQLKGLSFRAFVYGIAAHKVTDALRAIGRNRTEPVAELPDGPVTAVDSPEPRALAAEMSSRLGALLGHLTPRQREVIVLRVAVGLSAEETAQAVRSTPGTVRVIQHRALSRLRRILMGESTAQVLVDPAVADVVSDETPAENPGPATDSALDARGAPRARSVERRLGRLTDRERAVLERLARGRRAQSIAEEFGVSLTTIRTQIREVLHKLSVTSQLEAVALLNEHRRAGQEVRQPPPYAYDEKLHTTSIAAAQRILAGVGSDPD